MPIDLLDTFLSLPLEREFEGWITERILEYFESVNIQAHVWAVSPTDEKTWPADEHVWMSGKLFGLQFKRPYMADPLAGQAEQDFRRLYWPLNEKPDQFLLLRKRPEIFYCLPTFTNRHWRKPSLHHCVVWRPTPRAQPMTVWYDNTHGNIRSWARNIERHANSYRWGNFVERIQQCNFGLPVVGGVAEGPIEYLLELEHELLLLRSERLESISQLGTEPEEAPTDVEPLFIVNVEVDVPPG